MFTGIVEELGTIRSITKGADSAKLHINASKVLQGIKLGDSIAVNGVCLTATTFSDDGFTADCMAETLAKSNLGELAPGSEVNLERALRLGDRLGGHIVTGHIDGVGSIIKIERHDIAILITVKAPPAVMRYIIKKGSVAIDGTSLTVVDHTPDTFQVSLIPHTAHHTVLGGKKVGDQVNLEGDVLGKYIEKLMGQRQENSDPKSPDNISMDFLAKHGFL
ncbi:riboflavin synthase [Peptococcaceae bacterium 1198_IL3148]